MKPTISVVISAYNEEKKLDACLSSVKWADEIIVIDNSSTDDTNSIAQRFTQHVYVRPNKLMLNINKNFGFDLAKSEWILNLDADETVSEELHEEIIHKTSQSGVNGYWIPRKNILFGKWIQHGLWWPDKQLRLFRRGKGAFPCSHIHEYIAVDGKTQNLEQPIVHHNYETISQYLTKMDRCTTSEALVLQEKQCHFRWYDCIRLPCADFTKIFFAQEGYKDGVHGFMLALFQAMYTCLSLAKYWEILSFPEAEIRRDRCIHEIQQSIRDMRYWDLTQTIRDSPSFFQRMKTKIQRRVLRLI